MKTSSAKAKGRRLQKNVRDSLLKNAPDLEPDDIRSTPMGSSGEDLLLSPLARKKYPISPECKNTERLNIWGAIKQAIHNAASFRPVVFFTKNREKIWVAMELDYYLELTNEKKD